MKDVFIILTGPSLNDIAPEEREYIKSCPTISMSWYLLYWELFGVIPDHYIYVGPIWDHPTAFITEHGAIKAMSMIHEYHNLHTIWYLDNENKTYIDGGDIPNPLVNDHYDDNHRQVGVSNIKHIKKCEYNENLKTVEIDCGECSYYHDKWAHVIDDPLWFSSSIGSSINLATILYPGYNIKLIGNDGGLNTHFYTGNDKPLSMFSDDLIRYASAPSESPHYNTVGFNVPFMLKMVEKTGNRVYNCNYHSMFSDTDSKNDKFDHLYAYDQKIPYKTILDQT